MLEWLTTDQRRIAAKRGKGLAAPCSTVFEMLALLARTCGRQSLALRVSVASAEIACEEPVAGLEACPRCLLLRRSVLEVSSASPDQTSQAAGRETSRHASDIHTRYTLRQSHR